MNVQIKPSYVSCDVKFIKLEIWPNAMNSDLSPIYAFYRADNSKARHKAASFISYVITQEECKVVQTLASNEEITTALKLKYSDYARPPTVKLFFPKNNPMFNRYISWLRENIYT